MRLRCPAHPAGVPLYIACTPLMTTLFLTPPLQVHARDKAVDPAINWYEVARSMAGFTGADCMGLMQRAARMAARQVSAPCRGGK